MPFLRITNLTGRLVVLDSVAGLVIDRGEKLVYVTVSEVEALGDSLVRLQNSGLIDFNVFNTPDGTDDDVEYVTLADIRALSISAGKTAGVYILRPTETDAADLHPNTIVFNDWSELYAEFVSDGGGGFILADGDATLEAGSYDLGDAWIMGTGSTRPTITIPDGFSLSTNALRVRGADLVIDNSLNDIITVDDAEDGFIHLVDSVVTVVDAGDLLEEDAGAGGSVTVWLENATLASPTGTGFALRVGTGELAEIFATRLSEIEDDALAGPGDIDIHCDSTSIVSSTQFSHSGTLTIIFEDQASKVGYDDTLVAPVLGADNVQDAIDALKGGTGITKFTAVVTANASAGTNVTGVGGGANLSSPLGDYSSVVFVSNVDVYLNGVLLTNDAVSGGSNDVYPGDTPSDGDLKFNLLLKGVGAGPDQLTMYIRS